MFGKQSGSRPKEAREESLVDDALSELNQSAYNMGEHLRNGDMEAWEGERLYASGVLYLLTDSMGVPVTQNLTTGMWDIKET